MGQKDEGLQRKPGGGVGVGLGEQRVRLWMPPRQGPLAGGAQDLSLGGSPSGECCL